MLCTNAWSLVKEMRLSAVLGPPPVLVPLDRALVVISVWLVLHRGLGALLSSSVGSQTLCFPLQREEGVRALIACAVPDRLARSIL